MISLKNRWLVVPIAALLIAGCTDEFGLDHGLQSFKVRLVTKSGGLSSPGTEADRLAYVSGKPCGGQADCEADQKCVDGECFARFVVDVDAFGRDGNGYPYTGTVHFRVTPGLVAPSSAYHVMKKGKLRSAEIYVNRAIGEAHVWAEQDGFTPKHARFGQCNDGDDNDGNGLIDLADPGCLSLEDDQESTASLASGTSETLWFANPRIRDIQLTSKLAASPLVGQQVLVTGGRMVVTNVVSNGFYLTDLDDQKEDRYFNGIFIFTYSKPRFIEYGDVLCSFSGAVEEHVGMTQVVFPSYEDVYEFNEHCNASTPGIDATIKPPAPIEVTPLFADELETTSEVERMTNTYANSRLLEQFEGGLVTYADVEVSTRFIACDKNKNGLIDKATDEITCRNECQQDPLCTDLEGYFEYSQWAGVTAGRKKIYGSTALAERFKPVDMDYLGQPDKNGVCDKGTTEGGFLEYQCPARVLSKMTGSLRHIYLCGDSDETKCSLQFWVLDPRFNGDVVLDPTRDNDGDGVTGDEGDCDDNHTGVHPAATEKPGNGRDDDCDGTTDED